MKKRHRSKRWGKRVISRIGSVTAVVLLVTAVLYPVDWSYVMEAKERLERVLHTHPYFSVKEITISGYKKVRGSEIVAIT